MSVDPQTLVRNPGILEQVERVTLRLVTQGLLDFSQDALQIFDAQSDLPQDISEDITREAMDRIGASRVVGVRLFGKIDYKRALHVFHSEYSIRQALFVDSKAEDESAQDTVTIQRSQTSMRVMFVSRGRVFNEPAVLPTVTNVAGYPFLTTTVFVKYNYRDIGGGRNELVSLTIAGLPNGMLQQQYNPDPQSTIWRVGRHAPSRGEPFRVRLVFRGLKARANWRVQQIQLRPGVLHTWDN